MSIFNWGQKKQLSSEEYEYLANKFNTMLMEHNALAQKIAVMETNNNSLRGLINRKLNPPEIEKEKEKETKDIKENFIYAEKIAL